MQMRPMPVEADPFAVRPFLVFWELTRACALACSHCRATAQHRRDPSELSTREAFNLVDDLADLAPPMPMQGHVTSAYRSDALGRTFALALLKGGHARMGQTVYLPLPDGTVAARVTSSVLLDPEGTRRDG